MGGSASGGVVCGGTRFWSVGGATGCWPATRAARPGPGPWAAFSDVFTGSPQAPAIDTLVAWRALRFAYGIEPHLLFVTFVLVVSAYVPSSLTALWLKLLADGVVRGEGRLTLLAAGLLAGSIAFGWILNTVGRRVDREFRERAAVELEAHIARLQVSIADLEHHERPEYLDRLQVLRDHSPLLDRLYSSFMSVVGMVVQLSIAVGLLASVDLRLMLLAVFAIPAAVAASWRAGAERHVEQRAAPSLRLARHLCDLGTSAGPAKEIRVSRNGEGIIARYSAAWSSWLGTVSAVRLQSAVWQAGAWALFGVAYVGAIALAAASPHGSAGGALLVLAAGGNLAGYLGSTMGAAGSLRLTLDAGSRLAWLEDYAGAHLGRADAPVPQRLRAGVRFEGVSFRYPGTERAVLQDLTLDLPAGAVIAVVGENGAGKTTLCKLLCRLYAPTEGRILVDGVALARMDVRAWRERISGTVQDFLRPEFQVQTAVGIGDLPNCESAAVKMAVARAGAADVVRELPRGLATQLGPTWPDGVDLSFGQWQKVALARGFMREDPLLLLLDEPTAALDADTEFELFDRLTAEARATTPRGRITVLVSHRFATVRTADRIVVVHGTRVAEVGTHQELVARGGLYAELYRLQTRAYR